MKTFRGLGQRVEISYDGFELDGRTGTVKRVRRDGGAWVEIDDGLPNALRQFPKGDEAGRENHIILYPEDCTKERIKRGD